MSTEMEMETLRHPQIRCDSLRLHVMLQLHLVSGTETHSSSDTSNLWMFHDFLCSLWQWTLWRRPVCSFIYLFLSLSDASSLPGRLAKWCHDVRAGGSANQRRHAPTWWGLTTRAPSLDYPLDAYHFPVCAAFTGAITGLYHWLSQFPGFFFYCRLYIFMSLNNKTVSFSCSWPSPICHSKKNNLLTLQDIFLQ